MGWIETLKELDSREARIDYLQDRFMPKLEDPAWQDEFDINQEEIQKANRALTVEYVDVGFPVFVAGLFLIPSLLLTDLAVELNPQIYGLIIDICATVFIVFPSLKGGDLIASEIAHSSRVPNRLLRAQEMAFTNVAFVLLLFGFILQGIAVQLLPARELIPNNLLRGLAPSVLSAALPIASVLLSAWIFAKFRHYQLDKRESPTEHVA